MVLATCGFVDTDYETAQLILKLQLEDLDDLIRPTDLKGEDKERVMADDQFAFMLEKDELAKDLQILQDRQMTRSIARAVLSDNIILAANDEQERIAASDRAMACRLGGVPVPRAITNGPAAITNNEMEIELIDKLGALYVDYPLGDNASIADISVEGGKSSAWAASRPAAKGKTRECLMCGDDVPFVDIARLECNHECCRSCLTTMFEASILNEDRYPPKCCQAIVPYKDSVRLILPAVIIKEYDIKKIEWDTKNRVYCSNNKCLAFIASHNIVADKARCTHCGTTTCAHCKKPDHRGDCPEDEELNKTLKLIEDEGWRRCKKCNLAFDLLYGCNHITCKCGSEFCYVCGKKWKTCNCATWDENNLIRRAANIVDRRPNIQGANAGRLVEEVANRLLNVGHCEHDRGFVRRNYGGVCESCNFDAPDFHYECAACDTIMCYRCTQDL